MSEIFHSRAVGRAATAAAVLLFAAIPWVAHAARGPVPVRCVADGVSLEGAPRVRLEYADGSEREFCCVRCAEGWARDAGPAPSSVRVTDETSGRLVDASSAHFVASRVLAQPATRDRVHSFASEAEARRHADAYRGSLLTGAERPFGGAR